MNKKKELEQMKSNVKISINPKELGLIKKALANYNTRLDNLEARELGYEMDRKIIKERQIVNQMLRDLGVDNE